MYICGICVYLSTEEQALMVRRYVCLPPSTYSMAAMCEQSSVSQLMAFDGDDVDLLAPP